MARIRLCAALAVALIVLAAPVPGAGASEGKVVIAQGVDPSTLDAMNQQETPASVVATHLYDTLVERDQNLKLVPGLAAELPKLLAPVEKSRRDRTTFCNRLEIDVAAFRHHLVQGLHSTTFGFEGTLTRACQQASRVARPCLRCHSGVSDFAALPTSCRLPVSRWALLSRATVVPACKAEMMGRINASLRSFFSIQ